MAYASWSVVYGEQPSAAKWNILGSNDASFNDGTGIGAGVITSESLNATIACRAYQVTAQAINTTTAKITLSAENYDTGGDFDTTNYRFTAPVTGYYQVNASIRAVNIGDGNPINALIYVNGAEFSRATSMGSSASSDPSATISDLVYVVAGQYIELYANTASSVNTNENLTFMSIHFVGV